MDVYKQLQPFHYVEAARQRKKMLRRSRQHDDRILADRSRGSPQNREHDSREHAGRWRGTALGCVRASICMIMTGLVFHGSGSHLSSIYSLHLVMRSIPSVSSAREIQVREVKASDQPHAERGRQLYRRVVALGNDTPVGADVYFLRDRRRGNIRRYPKLVYALAHYEDREGFRQSLFWTTANVKLDPMEKRDLSLPFYNGLNLFVSSNRDRDDTLPVGLGFGRTLLDASEDEARLTQQKAAFEGTEQETYAQFRGNPDISPVCIRQAHVLLQLSTCNAYHERRVGASIDDDLSNDYLDLLLLRCDCMLLRS